MLPPPIMSLDCPDHHEAPLRQNAHLAETPSHPSLRHDATQVSWNLNEDKWGKLHPESFKHLLHPFALLINVEESGAPLLMLMPSRSYAVLSSNCGWFPWAFPPAGCQSSWCFHMTEMPGFGQSRHCSIDTVIDTVIHIAADPHEIVCFRIGAI